jgi:glycosyltransferase involved in cell wall biosynthesis
VIPQSVASALQRLYDDPTRREAFAAAAYRNAIRPEFNWTSIAARWRHLFDEMLAE